MIAIESQELLLPGDTFQILRQDLERITITPLLGSGGARRPSKKIKCEIIKIFIRSSYEIRYVCKTLEATHLVRKNTEFVIAQILTDFCKVKIKPTDKDLKVSAMVMLEAAAAVGARPFSDILPNFYLPEDAEKILKYLEASKFKERYGYLLLDNNDAT